MPSSQAVQTYEVPLPAAGVAARVALALLPLVEQVLALIPVWAEVKSLVSLPSSQQPFVASPYNVPLLSVVHELLLLMRLLRQLTWRASLNKFCLVGSPPCVIDTERPF